MLHITAIASVVMDTADGSAAARFHMGDRRGLAVNRPVGRRLGINRLVHGRL